MGFDEGRIILERENATYHAGEVIRGRLEFEQSKVKTFRGIYLEFKGYCTVHWTSSRSRRENDRTIHYTVPHDSYEEYVNAITYLVGSKSGEHHLQPGFHIFPFEFHIPPHSPSSFERSDGQVKYELKATVDRAFKIDQHKYAFVRVIAPLDLNHNPYCKEGIGLEFYNSYCCWCMSSGKSEIVVKVPAGGAVPGQTLPVEVDCKNDGTVEIDAIRFIIKRKIKFHAVNEPDTREEADKVLEIKKGPVPGNTSRSWVVDLTIPEMDVYNLDACRYIDVDFKFKVSVETSGCHTDDEESRPFIIGTIPLAGYNQPIESQEDQPVSHGFSQYPQNPHPNQPNTYPNPSPYPPNGAPYPPAPNVSPYPPAPNASPYPPAPNVTPYPPAPNTTPYPPAPNVTPYPPAPNASPYPPAPNASPYPNVTPYPPASNASPYPPASNASPYPPASNASPYPPASNALPYPPASNALPYPPASNAPYPTPPNAGFVATTLVKSGDPGHPEVMPLLPGAEHPTSPYASASAPEPSTPDVLGHDAKNPPAFNPYYKGDTVSK